MKFTIKKTVVLAAVALLAAACNTTQAPTKQGDQGSSQQQPTQNSPQPQTSTYKNDTYGFQFDYPKSMSFVTPTYGSLKDQVVQVQIPQSAYPKTNFGDAAFTVSAVYVKSLQACLSATTSGSSKGFKTQKQINGVNFYQATSSDAAAGNRYDSTLYRYWNGTNLCVELAETIHTGNIGNYPQGSVSEVDSSQVQQQLDAVLNTFKFTNK